MEIISYKPGDFPWWKAKLTNAKIVAGTSAIPFEFEDEDEFEIDWIAALKTYGVLARCFSMIFVPLKKAHKVSHEWH